MARLSRYVTRGHTDVHGWLYPPDPELISAIGLIQASEGITGSVGEIGVHEGRLFTLLVLLRRDAERAFCIDVFDRQALNVDVSGRGDEQALLRNLRRHAGDADEISIFRTRSQEVTAEQILDAAGEARMFSVDGGHAAAVVQHDVRLSSRVLGQRGVMLLDDFFNPYWPEVSDGARIALADDDLDLEPFAIGANKVFFTRHDQAIAYRDRLREAVPRRHLKDAELMGHPVAVFAPKHNRVVIRLRRAVRKLRGAARAGLHRGSVRIGP
jgi:Methyltransferase domain